MEKKINITTRLRIELVAVTYIYCFVLIKIGVLNRFGNIIII